jgi:hypothetical protein
MFHRQITNILAHLTRSTKNDSKKGGEMTQTLYAHMNKRNKKKLTKNDSKTSSEMFYEFIKQNKKSLFCYIILFHYTAEEE